MDKPSTGSEMGWTPEPWMVGNDMAMKHTYCTQIVGMMDGEPFIIGSLNYNFLDLAIVNCVRAVACVNAMAGIPDPAAFVDAVRMHLSTLDAHDIESLDCDRRGEKYCDCLSKSIDKLRSALSHPQSKERGA